MYVQADVDDVSFLVRRATPAATRQSISLSINQLQKNMEGKSLTVGAANSRKTFVFLKEGRFSRSRSSKVDKFGANRKRVCDFLLVRNSNFGPILHRFGDLTGFMCS